MRGFVIGAALLLTLPALAEEGTKSQCGHKLEQCQKSCISENGETTAREDCTAGCLGFSAACGSSTAFKKGKSWFTGLFTTSTAPPKKENRPQCDLERQQCQKMCISVNGGTAERETCTAGCLGLAAGCGTGVAFSKGKTWLGEKTQTTLGYIGGTAKRTWASIVDIEGTAKKTRNIFGSAIQHLKEHAN